MIFLSAETRTGTSVSLSTIVDLAELIPEGARIEQVTLRVMWGTMDDSSACLLTKGDMARIVAEMQAWSVGFLESAGEDQGETWYAAVLGDAQPFWLLETLKNQLRYVVGSPAAEMFESELARVLRVMLSPRLGPGPTVEALGVNPKASPQPKALVARDWLLERTITAQLLPIVRCPCGFLPLASWQALGVSWCESCLGLES